MPGRVKGVEHQLDDLVGTVAQHHVLAGEAKVLRDCVTQVETAAIRVKVDPRDRLPHRLDGLRRRPKRVLVRGQLDDRRRIETQLARHVIDRLARLVRNQIKQYCIGDPALPYDWNPASRPDTITRILTVK